MQSEQITVKCHLRPLLFFIYNMCVCVVNLKVVNGIMTWIRVNFPIIQKKNCDNITFSKRD